MTASNRILALAAACAVFVANPAFAMGKCVTQREADALHMRVLQTDLMVSGLACQLHKDYASFVKTQKRNLASHAAVLQQYFNRTGGGTKAMDKFITSLANGSSTQSLNMKESVFCRRARDLFAEVNSLSHQKLLDKLATTPDIVARRGAPLCAQTAKK